MMLPDLQDAPSEAARKEADGTMWVEGHTVPHKRVGTVEEVYATNILKVLILNPPIRLTLNKTLKAFTTISNKTLAPYWLSHLDHAPKHALYLTYGFLANLGARDDLAWQTALVVGHVLQFDQAYRFRLQDLAGETTTQQLTTKPRKELQRLLELHRERDHKDVSIKFKRAVRVLLLVLLIPKCKWAFTHTITCLGIERLRFDENDTYWAKLKVDYKYHV